LKQLFDIDVHYFSSFGSHKQISFVFGIILAHKL